VALAECDNSLAEHAAIDPGVRQGVLGVDSSRCRDIYEDNNLIEAWLSGALGGGGNRMTEIEEVGPHPETIRFEPHPLFMVSRHNDKAKLRRVPRRLLPPLVVCRAWPGC
jgi:hypothetical protein